MVAVVVVGVLIGGIYQLPKPPRPLARLQATSVPGQSGQQIEIQTSHRSGTPLRTTVAAAVQIDSTRERTAVGQEHIARLLRGVVRACRGWFRLCETCTRPL